MIKKILGGVAALGLAAAIGFAPNANAACGATADQDDATTNDNVADLPTAGHVYGDDPQDGAGYIGVTGSHGYIELEGGANGVDVDGSSTDAPVQGQVGTGGVCVNDTSAP